MAKKLDFNTKEKILKSVEEIIQTDGIKDFSLRDIARKANISLGTLYYHYNSKDELVIDLASLYLDRLDKDYFSWLKRHKDDLTPDRFLDVIFYKGVKLFDRAKLHLFLLNECIGGNKKLLNKYSNLYKYWRENLNIGIKQVFPNVKDSNSFASLLMMIVDGMISQEVLKLENKVDQDKIKNLLKEFIK